MAFPMLQSQTPFPLLMEKKGDFLPGFSDSKPIAVIAVKRKYQTKEEKKGGKDRGRTETSPMLLIRVIIF